MNELDQTNGLEGPMLTSSNPNDGTFNLGDNLYAVIPHLTIQDGGTLHINGDVPLGFGEDDQAFSAVTLITLLDLLDVAMN